MNIGNKIQKLRNDCNMSQAEFAEKFHVTRQTVSNWENNKNYPDLQSLKNISNEFDVSFDELIKDDMELIDKIDETRRKADRRKRIILAGIILIPFLLLALVIHTFIHAFDATPDAERITTDADIRMFVDTPDSTPSAAITVTFFRDNKTLPEKLMKNEAKVKGRVEGDIPAIFTDASPSVDLHFQDLYYKNIAPNIKSVKTEFRNVVTEKKSTENLEYTYDNGRLTLKFEPDTVMYNSEDLDWYDCVITVEYSFKGKEYVSMTALNVLEN